MNDDPRKPKAEKIVKELAARMPDHEGFRKSLEAFADFPPDRVADTILKELEYLLGSDLRELIIHMIEQDISAEALAEAEAEAGPEPVPEPVAPPAPPPGSIAIPAPSAPIIDDAAPTTESIMEHFGPKESFPSEAVDFSLAPTDWLYVYGFSYAPDSTGKGVPTRKLLLKGVDGSNNIFLLDYGDVRLYLTRLQPEEYSVDKSGRPALQSQKTNQYKVQHERTLNLLRSEEVMVTVPFWTIVKGRELLINAIEDHYVELLRALIDIHDATDWDVEVFALDSHIMTLPAIAQASSGRAEMRRESKHNVSKPKDVKVIERLIFREKDLAQQIHSNLLLHAQKAKVDYMIRLDAAFMDDWKSIMLARYIVGKEKRKAFCQTVMQLETEFGEYELLFKVSTPTIRYKFPVT